MQPLFLMPFLQVIHKYIWNGSSNLNWNEWISNGVWYKFTIFIKIMNACNTIKLTHHISCSFNHKANWHEYKHYNYTYVYLVGLGTIHTVNFSHDGNLFISIVTYLYKIKLLSSTNFLAESMSFYWHLSHFLIVE